jgi:N6-L-threonylcarbamoyladenine synthase
MTVLGIDTSCYTTSVALFDPDGIVRDERLLLQAPQGSRGMRQSDALFHHVQQLPQLMERLGNLRDSISGVAVSARPRPVEGSYMPVFTAGLGCARALASALGVPLLQSSHQEGHIAAGCLQDPAAFQEPFLAFHLSGGTTELLFVTPKAGGYDVDLVGHGLDVHAGQLVDRIGVALGLGFPAGPAMEKLAQQCTQPQNLGIKVRVTGADCNLSGAEAAARRAVEAGANGAAVAHAVQAALAEGFSAMALHAARERGLNRVLFIGGVASNAYLRREMSDRLQAAGVDARFAAPGLSSDNAVGVASLGYQFLQIEENR